MLQIPLIKMANVWLKLLLENSASMDTMPTADDWLKCLWLGFWYFLFYIIYIIYFLLSVCRELCLLTLPRAASEAHVDCLSQRKSCPNVVSVILHNESETFTKNRVYSVVLFHTHLMRVSRSKQKVCGFAKKNGVGHIFLLCWFHWCHTCSYTAPPLLLLFL